MDESGFFAEAVVGYEGFFVHQWAQQKSSSHVQTNMAQSLFNSWSKVSGIKMLKRISSITLGDKFNINSINQRLSLKTASLIFNLPKLKYEDMYSNPLILLKSEELDIYK